MPLAQVESHEGLFWSPVDATPYLAESNRV